MNQKPRIRSNRRQFLQSLGAGVAMAGYGTLNLPISHAQEKAPANERIRLGVIGYGKRSRPLMNSAMRQPDTQVVAISEVVDERLRHGLQTATNYYSDQTGRDFKGVNGYVDFREMFEKEDLDAVIIGTPDHSHAVQCILAAREGMDIYCEKPLTLTIHEGRVISNVVRDKGLVFQTGSQQRSEYNHRFKRAAELIRNGYLGEIREVFVNVGPPPVPCDLPGEPIPDGTRWDLWVGPAAYRDYNEILCPQGIHNHFPAFRQYREFAGGPLADIGAHHFDIVQWALGMDDTGPVSIVPPEDGSQRNLVFTYANGIRLTHGGDGSITFIGSEGTLKVGRGQLESDPQTILQIELKSTDRPVYESTNHMRNWLDCVHSRGDTICTAEIGHRSASVCHLANLGYRLGRALQWDPQKEQFVNDPEANQLLFTRHRAPWNLKEFES